MKKEKKNSLKKRLKTRMKKDQLDLPESNKDLVKLKHNKLLQ